MTSDDRGLPGTPPWAVLRGGNQRLLDRVLADREVLIAPHQHAQDLRSKLPQQVLDASVGRQVLICSMSNPTSDSRYSASDPSLVTTATAHQLRR